MYCAQCGQANAPNARFCQGCGASLQDTALAPRADWRVVETERAAGYPVDVPPAPPRRSRRLALWLGVLAGIFAICFCGVLAIGISQGSSAAPRQVSTIAAVPLAATRTTALSPTARPTMPPSPAIAPTVAVAQPTLQSLSSASDQAPAPPGQSVEIQGHRVRLIGYEPDAWRLMQATNPAAKPPGPGFRFATVRIQVTNVARGGEVSYITDADFQLTGASRRTYTTYGNSCGYHPGALLTELRTIGQQAEGNACWWIPADERDLVVIWVPNLGISGERRYLAVGQ